MEFKTRILRALAFYCTLMNVTEKKYPSLYVQTKHMALSYLIFPMEDHEGKPWTEARAMFIRILKDDISIDEDVYHRGTKDEMTLKGGFFVVEIETLMHYIDAFPHQLDILSQQVDVDVIRLFVYANLLALRDGLNKLDDTENVLDFHTTKATAFLGYLNT